MAEKDQKVTARVVSRKTVTKKFEPSEDGKENIAEMFARHDQVIEAGKQAANCGKRFGRTG